MTQSPSRDERTRPTNSRRMRTAIGSVAFGVLSTMVWALCESTPLDQWQQLGIFAISAAAWITSSWSFSP